LVNQPTNQPNNLPLGFRDLPHLLGDCCDALVTHILQELLDSLLLTQGPQGRGRLKVGVAGEEDVVTWWWWGGGERERQSRAGQEGKGGSTAKSGADAGQRGEVAKKGAAQQIAARTRVREER
jgi:hypothetical protein